LGLRKTGKEVQKGKVSFTQSGVRGRSNCSHGLGGSRVAKSSFKSNDPAKKKEKTVHGTLAPGGNCYLARKEKKAKGQSCREGDGGENSQIKEITNGNALVTEEKIVLVGVRHEGATPGFGGRNEAEKRSTGG